MINEEKVEFLLELGVLCLERYVSIIQQSEGGFKVIDHHLFIFWRSCDELLWIVLWGYRLRPHLQDVDDLSDIVSWGFYQVVTGILIYIEFLVYLTTSKTTPACLIRQLLIRAGIEQNPGPDPWPCILCNRWLTSTSVQCTKCKGWLHIKCSTLPSAKHRSKHNNWIGPCCRPSFSPAPPTHSQPPHHTPPRPQPPARLPRHARRHDLLVRALLQRHHRPRRRSLFLQLELGRRRERRPLLLQPGMMAFSKFPALLSFLSWEWCCVITKSKSAQDRHKNGKRPAQDRRRISAGLAQDWRRTGAGQA